MSQNIDYDCDCCGESNFVHCDVRGLEKHTFHNPKNSGLHICKKCFEHLKTKDWEYQKS